MKTIRKFCWWLVFPGTPCPDYILNGDVEETAPPPPVTHDRVELLVRLIIRDIEMYPDNWKVKKGEDKWLVNETANLDVRRPKKVASSTSNTVVNAVVIDEMGKFKNWDRIVTTFNNRQLPSIVETLVQRAKTKQEQTEEVKRLDVVDPFATDPEEELLKRIQELGKKRQAPLILGESDFTNTRAIPKRGSGVKPPTGGGGGYDYTRMWKGKPVDSLEYEDYKEYMAYLKGERYA